MLKGLYLDSPDKLDAYVKALKPIERKAFNKGYMLAILNFLEHMNETQIKLLNKILELEEEGNEAFKKQLASRLHIIDVHERYWQEQLESLLQTKSLKLEAGPPIKE